MEYIDYYIRLILVASIFIYCVSEDCKTNFSLSVSEREEGQGTTMNCHTESCGSEVLFKKKVNGRYEIALKFTSLSESQGFELSNGVNYDDPRIIAFSWFGQYTMDFVETIVQDTGTWQCSADEHDSNELILIVNSKRSNVQITIETPPFILLGSQYEYNCSTRNVYPELDVLWNINSENVTGDIQNEQNGDVYDIINIYRDTLYKRMEYNVTCYMGKSTGNITWSKPKPAEPVEIFAPTKLKFYPPNNQTTPSDNFTMSCTVSGTSPIITWKHNDSDITAIFTQDTYTIHGNFSYSEPTALRSTLVWILPEESKWCSELGKYGGHFQCIGNSEKGPEKESDRRSVTVQYLPILPEELVKLKALEDDVISLECHVDCAMPPVHTYQWSSVLNKPGLDRNQAVIQINVTQDDFNDNFTCTAINDVGSSSMHFVIEEIQIEISTTQEPEISTTTDEQTTSFFNGTDDGGSRQALIVANAVIWSLCGVVAVVLVFLALYHYRQIQEGNKRMEYSDATPLTENEAKPGTSRGTGEYADISSAHSGGVGGLPNEGIYSDVRTPAQMPVAPQHTSKTIGILQKQGTPKTKRTHAPATHNFPMNARRQDHSAHTSDRRPEPAADYSPGTRRKDPSPQHSNNSNHGAASKVEQQQRMHESPNKPATGKPNSNVAKPSVPVKPNVQSMRSSRTSTSGGFPSPGINPAGAPYDNAEGNLYANCDQSPVPKNNDGTITYADLALQHEDPYDEGAPPVPTKNMTDQEPVQYASIKH